MSWTYRIEAGSAVDKAINEIVAATVEHPEYTVADLGPAWTALDPDNEAHMLALGTRLQLLRFGVRDPDTLVARLHAQWYGGTA